MLVYTLLREPGYYCKSTGERIPISAAAWARAKTVAGDLSRREALNWLATRGLAEDDYEVTQAYEVELAEDAHAKYRGVPSPCGRLVAAHTLEA